MTDNSTLIAIVKAAAIHHGIDPAVACAVAEQESSWNPWALRYEPEFYSRYIEAMTQGAKPLNATEARARACSWGLMQILGEVARELGYTGDIAALCEPSTGAEWGCRKLAKCLADSPGDVSKALLSWNGGGNAAYPSQVLARVSSYR